MYLHGKAEQINESKNKAVWGEPYSGKEIIVQRKKILVLYTVNCSSHVAYQIAAHFEKTDHDVCVTGNESCYDNQVMVNRLLRYVTHPNVASVLIVSHGCEFIQGELIRNYAEKNGHRAEIIYTQQLGTEKAINEGIRRVQSMLDAPISCIPVQRLPVLGVVVSNSEREPVLDQLAISFCVEAVTAGNAVLLLPGLPLEALFGQQPNNPDAAALMHKAGTLSKEHKTYHCYEWIPQTGFPENFVSLTRGILKLSEQPVAPGIWLVDTYQDKELYRGFPNRSPSSDLMELCSCGAAMSLVLSTRGNILSTPLMPLYKVILQSGTPSCLNQEADVLLDESSHIPIPLLLGNIFTGLKIGRASCRERV